MLKKLLIAFSLLMGSTNCAHYVKEPTTKCTDDSCSSTLKSSSPSSSSTIKGTGWSVNLPVEFIVNTNPTNPIKTANGNRELVATSSKKDLTSRGPLLVMMTVVDLTKDLDPNKFGEAAAIALAEQDDIKVLSVKLIDINGHPGTLTFGVADNIVIVQLAVGSKNHGYMLACAGDIRESRHFNEKCSEVLKTFQLD